MGQGGSATVAANRERWSAACAPQHGWLPPPYVRARRCVVQGLADPPTGLSASNSPPTVVFWSEATTAWRLIPAVAWGLLVSADPRAMVPRVSRTLRFKLLVAATDPAIRSAHDHDQHGRNHGRRRRLYRRRRRIRWWRRRFCRRGGRIPEPLVPIRPPIR